MISKNRLLFLFIFSLLINSCKKEEALTVAQSGTEWIRVLDEHISGITEDDTFLGQNGKVLTDEQDNIYVYYYSEFPKQAVVLKCDPDGMQIWKKTFPDCTPMDMVRNNEGSIILAVRDLPGFEQVFNLYEIKSDLSVIRHTVIQTNIGGSGGVLNANMHVMPDNTIVISGVYLRSFFVGFPLSSEGFVLKLDNSYNKEWNFILFSTNYYIQSDPYYEQNSIVPTNDGKYIVEFSYKGDKVQADSISYGIFTALVNPDSANFDTSYVKQTGFEVQSNGNKGGYFNSYGGRLLEDISGESIFHYSRPKSITTGLTYNSNTPSGFIRIGADARIKDTIPMPLPEGYRIISCTKGVGNFLLTAVKSGTVDVSNDFGAFQTLFLTGNSNWQTTNSFSFQEFYSDFFPSSAPMSDGSFVIMGKIQSFNGPNNKLVLIKWKNN